MKIQVLGSGCSTCKNLYELTKNAVEQLGLKYKGTVLVQARNLLKLSFISISVLIKQVHRSENCKN